MSFDVALELIPGWLLWSTAAVLGLCGGSFLNVVIHRLPRGLSLSHPGSHCPTCKKPIAARDNVPLLGWLLLGGKSRCCKEKISPQYPLVELVGGLMAGALVTMKIAPFTHTLTVGQAALLFLSYLSVSLGLVAAAVIDWEHMILPDSITWGGAGLGIATAWLRPEVTTASAALGAAVGYLGIWLPFIWAHEKLRGFPGMGLGDAKLMALAGAWLGPLGALLTLFAGAVQGTLFAVSALLATGKIEEPAAVQQQRADLLQAIDEAEGEEKKELLREFHSDPLALPPSEAPGGLRVAFGPFLSLSIIELLLFFEPAQRYLEAFFLL